ncbi:hypothetical protein SLE2022_030570 [Rubroshorea leprosula]|uniref:Uncharacterized protein n=1 Tax=Rubroshorea leprosula TaxID=152421 RepID=A0AAV5JP57_9ROSI|nr:hypothetical protein SLEP1_g24225 [Rubroshorea leprosula]
MGNCVMKGFGKVEEMVKVMTCSGGVMELYTPITAECITNEFPGHAIYRSRDNIFSPPLLHTEQLHAGQLYYLLPINNTFQKQNNQDGGVLGTPYRVSLDSQRVMKRAEAEVLPRYNGSGVWKVKLVINPEQLADILAQEARTEELIESVRTVAKCGSGVSSVGNSDKWSVSSSWKGSFSRKGEETN